MFSVWLLKIILKREIKVLLIVKSLTIETGNYYQYQESKIKGILIVLQVGRYWENYV